MQCGHLNIHKSHIIDNWRYPITIPELFDIIRVLHLPYDFDFPAIMCGGFLQSYKQQKGNCHPSRSA